MTARLLTVTELGKRYPISRGLLRAPLWQTTLRDVSFTLESGQTIAVVGESGSGKSTLARQLVGLETPSVGDILLNGSSIVGRQDDALRQLRRDIRMVFQNPSASLNPRVTVGAQLDQALQHLAQLGPRQRQERIHEALASVGLPADHRHHYPHQFSGGQRQRVAIARAILLQPKLIIADEPVSTLDASVQAQILNLLMDLQEARNLSFVFISHDLGVVKTISDQVLVLYAGEVMELGPTTAIFRHPQHPYTRALIASSPVVQRALQVPVTPLRGELATSVDAGIGCPFARRCPHADERCRRERPTPRWLDQQLVSCHKTGAL
ncbi:ATP-binding cassette domain-containing protein [Permianibacter sp. IMCC34836]|uniref:oligopeptide/dipeptide ABC transporter ATP-binding protein n=1 Tax=Permianibacter fluminis TaxID=2738515 RepID=UPI0015529DA4|nr:oligopeptide/dipeptide ABC transporter ATP-binding protein [Permianibacter fluminis]NQD38720.1 ATP-binding cassette domain-containing protein [Permianibacter fluminis]